MNQGDEAWDSMALIGSEGWNEGNYDEDSLLKEELFPNGYGNVTICSLVIKVLVALNSKLSECNNQILFSWAIINLFTGKLLKAG